MLSKGISIEIEDFLPGLTFATCERIVRQRALQWYKRTVVLSRLHCLEQRWIVDQLASLYDDGLVPYAALAPIRRQW